MKKNQAGFTITNLLIVVAIFVLVISWGANLYKLTQCDFKAPYKAEVLHTIGIIPIVAPFVVWVDDSPAESK